MQKVKVTKEVQINEDTVLEPGDVVVISESNRKGKTIRKKSEAVSGDLKTLIEQEIRAAVPDDSSVQGRAYDGVEEFLDNECDLEGDTYTFTGSYAQDLVFEYADNATDIYNASLWEWAGETNGRAVEDFIEEFGGDEVAKTVVDRGLVALFMAAQQTAIERGMLRALNELAERGILVGTEF